MVFSSSPPLYLDPPNWHHQLQLQPNQHRESGQENPQLPPPPPPIDVGGGGGSSIRAGSSMVDQARVAKLPQPEAGLNCPRCDSTNTKFCYFNNYSLSQPRHFCKTCRRYWTRGGALRNVPVGGGCRRNKRTKTSSNSKPSPQLGPKSTITSTTSTPSSTHHHNIPQFPPQFPFMPSSLQNHNFLQPQMVGLGLRNSTTDLGFQLGGSHSCGGSDNILSGVGDQWRLHYMGGGGGNIDPTSNLYPFQNEGFEALPSNSLVGDHHHRQQLMESMTVAPVKMEDTHNRLNLPKGFLGISDNNQFWSGNPWNDLSGLNSSSTNHLL